jgi:hypothetical protein
MDASDRIRKLQAQAVFGYYKANVLTSTTCNTTDCTAGLGANCIVQYPDFQEKLQVAQGKAACNKCAGTCNC